MPRYHSHTADTYWARLGKKKNKRYKERWTVGIFWFVQSCIWININICKKSIESISNFCWLRDWRFANGVNDWVNLQNWGSDFTFHVPSIYGMHGAWPKKIPNVTSKIPIFTYRTRVHLDSTSNQSKSCRGLIFVHSVQFGNQTDIIRQR